MYLSPERHAVLVSLRSLDLSKDPKDLQRQPSCFPDALPPNLYKWTNIWACICGQAVSLLASCSNNKFPMLGGLLSGASINTAANPIVYIVRKRTFNKFFTFKCRESDKWGRVISEWHQILWISTIVSHNLCKLFVMYPHLTPLFFPRARGITYLALTDHLHPLAWYPSRPEILRADQDHHGPSNHS